MIRIFKQHEDWVLAVGGILLGVVIIIFMILTIRQLSRDLSLTANGQPSPSKSVSFDLETAKSLNLKGLSQ